VVVAPLDDVEELEGASTAVSDRLRSAAASKLRKTSAWAPKASSPKTKAGTTLAVKVIEVVRFGGTEREIATGSGVSHWENIGDSVSNSRDCPVGPKVPVLGCFEDEGKKNSPFCMSYATLTPNATSTSRSACADAVTWKEGPSEKNGGISRPGIPTWKRVRVGR
jgi:hypothetical protein